MGVYLLAWYVRMNLRVLKLTFVGPLNGQMYGDYEIFLNTDLQGADFRFTKGNLLGVRHDGKLKAIGRFQFPAKSVGSLNRRTQVGVLRMVKDKFELHILPASGLPKHNNKPLPWIVINDNNVTRNQLVANDQEANNAWQDFQVRHPPRLSHSSSWNLAGVQPVLTPRKRGPPKAPKSPSDTSGIGKRTRSSKQTGLLLLMTRNSCRCPQMLRQAMQQRLQEELERQQQRESR